MKNAIVKSMFALVAGLFISFAAVAQYTASEQKSIDKSKELYKKGKYDKAISIITKVQNNHFYDDDLWTLRCIYEYDRYDAQLLADLLSILKGSKKTTFKSTEYNNELLISCYTATLVCSKQEFASAVLHEKLIQPSTDTAVGDDARDMYSKGGDDFKAEDYNAAIRSYEKACKLDSNYYKATYAIGSCYQKLEEYDKAIPYFQKSVRLQPDMLDNHQSLIECYVQEKRWQDAYNACIDGIISYPDAKYFTYLEQVRS